MTIHTIVLILAWSIVTYVGGTLIVDLIFDHAKSDNSSPRSGDCSDEMFEAMREVDAITPSVPPMLIGKLAPREPRSLNETLNIATKPSKTEAFCAKYRARFDPITLQFVLPDGSKYDALKVYCGEIT